MIIDCVLASPGGDIPLGPSERRLPFKTAPGDDHPFLSLGDYFELLKAFLSEDRCSALSEAVSLRLNRTVSFEEISHLMIRSEKHGAFYHVAMIEVLVKGVGSMRFALNTALTEAAMAHAAREFRSLRTLREAFDYPYLPQAYFHKELDFQVRGRRVRSALFLCEWFEDFHEWHLTRGWDGCQRVCIWDMGERRRVASEAETLELFKLAASILTLYYDMETSRRIHPVHHAAGDFVVKVDATGLQVRLTTARTYSPLMPRDSDKGIPLLVALFYFFLDLTVRMRLDREEGIGAPIWAEGFSLRATVEGFLAALVAKEKEGKLDRVQAGEFRTLLRSFSPQELEEAFQPLMADYRLTQPGDLDVIEDNLEAHIRDLHRVIQDLQ